jgi:tRNA (cmo5U34)-methyltransferase
MTEDISDWHVWLQASAVQEYLRLGDETIPSRREQVQVMLSLIPFQRNDPLHVLDLGCGDGILLEAILRNFRNVRKAIAIDGSSLMLERAAERLQEYGNRVEYVTADLGSSNLIERLSLEARFDVVISGFAIHHLEDEGKQDLYQKIYCMLCTPGVFVNIEHVRSQSPRGERLFEAWYASHLIEIERSRSGQQTPEQIVRSFMERSGKLANRLTLLEDQLQWLRSTGFEEVDCYWKYYELAVFAGYKS